MEVIKFWLLILSVGYLLEVVEVASLISVNQVKFSSIGGWTKRMKRKLLQTHRWTDTHTQVHIEVVPTWKFNKFYTVHGLYVAPILKVKLCICTVLYMWTLNRFPVWKSAIDQVTLNTTTNMKFQNSYKRDNKVFQWNSGTRKKGKWKSFQSYPQLWNSSPPPNTASPTRRTTSSTPQLSTSSLMFTQHWGRMIGSWILGVELGKPPWLWQREFWETLESQTRWIFGI